MDENFKIGNFICELRRSKGLSQAELGKRLNVTNKAVSRWETGRGLPDSGLLLPLSRELGVTVDELLRGQFVTSVAKLSPSQTPVTERNDGDTIKRQNILLDYRGAKKQLIRDSCIVIPAFLFICVWLGLRIDLVPTADYQTSVIVNLLLPLWILAAAQIVYAVFLIADSIRMEGRKPIMKLFIGIGIWYAVVHLFFFVYLYRVIRFLVLRHRMKTVEKAC